jgi:uncharacterized cupredoxin-like copper-binding protein
MPKLKLAVGLAVLVTVVALAPLAIARTHAAQAATVTVKASEYKFVLSKKSAPHGKVTFKVTNKGKIAHDFKIAGHKTAKLKPGKSATLSVTLTKGKHPYVCTVDSHAKFGMKGVFQAS